MKTLARTLALSLMLICLLAAPALALVEPQSKNLEQTLTYDYDTLKIQIDQWHYAYKKHDVRFFVVPPGCLKRKRFMKHWKREKLML